jgi:hypothetical protein
MTDEEQILFSIMEQQRNVAMTELARAAARNAVLEQELAKARSELESNRV